VKLRIFVATVITGVVGIVIYVLRMPQADTRQVAKQQRVDKSNLNEVSKLVNSSLG